MRKQLLSALCVLTILAMSTVTVMATSPEPDFENIQPISDSVDVTIEDGVVGSTSGRPVEVNGNLLGEPATMTVSSIGHFPFEIQYTTHNGAPVIIKSFRVPVGFDPLQLVEADFEDTGSMFTKKDILRNELPPVVENREGTDRVTLETDSNDMETILAAFPQFLDYNMGGFIGRLELDVSSIQSTSSGTEATFVPIRRTVEHTNLPNNDMAFIPKTYNGLNLVDVRWVPMGGSARGDELVAAFYNAIATYAGTSRSERDTGFSIVATYRGTVTRTIPGEVIYSIIYHGTVILVETESEFPWSHVGIGFGFLVLGTAAIYLVITKLFTASRKRHRSRYTAADDLSVGL